MANNAAENFKQLLKIKKQMEGKLEVPKRLPKWQFAATFEREYYKLVRKIIMQFVNKVNNSIRERLKMWEPEMKIDTANEEFDKELRELQELDNEIFFENRKELDTELFVLGLAISRYNAKQQMKFAEKVAGLKDLANPEDWKMPMINQWVTNNTQLIRGLEQEYIKKISNTVISGYNKGLSSNAIAKDINKINSQISRYRARLIARNETENLNAIITKKRQEDIGVEMYIWRTAGDERVRDSHSALDNMLCRWDDRNVYSNDGGKTWIQRESSMDIAHPGEPVNCFSGDTMVNSPIFIDKLYRRFYTGETTVLTLDNGTIFKCTPNHPILFSDFTMRQAKLLNVGDDIVSIKEDALDTSCVRKTINRKPTFKQVFDFFNIMFHSHKVVGAVKDFHGDGIVDKDIDIISINRELCNSTIPIVDKDIIDLFFSITSTHFIFKGCDRLLNKGFSLDSTPFGFFIGFFRNLLSFRETHFRKSDIIGLRAVSDFNFMLSENSIYNIAATRILGRNSEHTITGDIFFDDDFIWHLFLIVCRSFVFYDGMTFSPHFFRKCVGVTFKDFGNFSKSFPGNIKTNSIVDKRTCIDSFHVYNLENKLGWYSITQNNNIVKNCRCRAEPFFKELLNEV